MNEADNLRDFANECCISVGRRSNRINIRLGIYMKLNVRIALESLVFSLALILIYFISQMVLGYAHTKNDVPDIMASYESVDYLQSNVSFGTSYEYKGIIIFLCFIFFALAYYAIRCGIQHFIKRSRI